MSPFKANLKTEVSMTPKGSQIVIFSLIILTFFCFATGFYFMYHEIRGAWIPLVIACTVLLIAATFWLLTYREVDSRPPAKTKFEAEDQNLILRVETDTKSLVSTNLLEKIANYILIVNNRKPLPAPDGLVDSNANPIANSVSEATKRVRQVNAESDRISEDLRIQLGELENQKEIFHVIPNLNEIGKESDNEEANLIAKPNEKAD